jgi:hypothetical protein
MFVLYYGTKLGNHKNIRCHGRELEYMQMRVKRGIKWNKNDVRM